MREAGPNIGTSPAASPGPVAERTARVAPAIFVDAFSTIGQPRGAAFAPDPLRRKVADAMARFDGIVIAEAPTAGAKPLSWSEYRFAGSLEYHEDGTTTLGFRLIDMSDGTVVWSRTFPRLHVEGDAGALEEAILREVVPAVAQPFGIVWTRELASHRVTDARRACILDAIEYWRSFNPARHEVVRQCLERLAAQEPRYAPVYSGLALVYLRDFFLDIAHQGEMPALDRGLQFAEHAVELRPHSARAHDMLSTIWFARGETDLGFGAVKRAIELNPYDTNIIATYGAHLVSIGEVDRGLAMLDDAGARSTVGQSWFEFYRFLARYLKGDVAGASLHASMIVGSDSLYSALAHAVLAGRTGDTATADLAVGRLIALNPAWRTEPKRQLAKFFPATEIRERLLQDLHAAGIPPTD